MVELILDSQMVPITVTIITPQLPVMIMILLLMKVEILQKNAGFLNPLFKKYVPVDPGNIPAPSPKNNYGKITFTQFANLLDENTLAALSTSVVQSAAPKIMEDLGQDYGFVLYRTHVRGPLNGVSVTIQDVHDRALVFVNKQFSGVIQRDQPQNVVINVPADGAQLDILVENMGRINFGPLLSTDVKGITVGVRLNYQFQYNWTHFTLPMKNLASIPWKSTWNLQLPAFFKATFQVNQDQPLDTFVSLPNWVKGFVVINGFNLGRYWNIGPQRNLYLPGPLLKRGTNELIVFELNGLMNPSVELVATSNLG